MIPRFIRSQFGVTTILGPLLLLPVLALTQTIPEVPPEIVSAWKLNGGNSLLIFRYDGIYYQVQDDASWKGVERGNFSWDKATSAFSATTHVDTNGEAGLSNPGGATTMTISGNTLTYNVAGEGLFTFSRVVNTASAIVGSWFTLGGKDTITFLADGTYYQAATDRSIATPIGWNGIERGTYSWNSSTGAFTKSVLTDTNGNVGLSGSGITTMSLAGNVMTFSGATSGTLQRITTSATPLPVVPGSFADFSVEKFAQYTQTANTAPSPVPLDLPAGNAPFWGESYIHSIVGATAPTLKIGTRTPLIYVQDSDGDFGIEDDTYGTKTALDAATAFPDGTTYQFKSGTDTASLSFPASVSFPTVPKLLIGSGTWSSGTYRIDVNGTLSWTGHASFNPATDLTLLSITDNVTYEDVLKEFVIQGDVTSYDLSNKLVAGRDYWVSIETLKIASSTTIGTGVFAGKLGHALHDSANSFLLRATANPVVELITLSKNIEYVQTGPSTVIVNPEGITATHGGTYGFFTEVQGRNIASLTAPTVTPPAGTVSFQNTLQYNSGDLLWGYGLNGDEFNTDTQTLIDSKFPNGTYTFLVNGTSVALSLPGNSFYPNTPQFTLSGGTWVNGKYAMDAANPLTVTTNVFAQYGSNADAHMGLAINDLETQSFASSQPASNFATLTAPAFTLPTNQISEIGADFDAIVSKSTVLPGALAAAFYTKSLSLFVYILPKISSQTASQVVGASSSLTLQVTATGTPLTDSITGIPLSPIRMNYQWSKGGTVLVGMTARTLTLTNFQAADAASYTCTVTNDVGSVTSAPIYLEFADSFQSYAASYGLNSLTTGAPDADFDNDGIPNLLEYLLGGNPTLPSSGLLPAVTKAPGSNNLVFTYKRKLAATGVTQVIEHATKLSSPWTPALHGAGGVTIITAAVPGDATAEQVTVTIPSTSTSRFVRLKASR